MTAIVDDMMKRASKIEKFKGEPYKCWKKAKELRLQIYREYAEAHEKGGLRVAGSSWGFIAVPRGLGDDVYYLASEPYGASTANETEFSRKCMEAAEVKGWAPDLCGYIRNYLGCIYLDVYTFGGPWPKADLIWQIHLCCSHAKWYQAASEAEGGIPFYACDVSTGPYEVGPGREKLKEHKLQYLVSQVLDGIDWMEKVTGRKFDDEKFIQAVNNDCDSTSLWADICVLNTAVPAPIDEKSMFAWFNLAGIGRERKDVLDFYKELYDEIKDRVARGVAAVPNERFRLVNYSSPPWGELDIFRYLEQFGCVSIGADYSFAQFGVWEYAEDGTLRGRKTPAQQGIVMRTREEAVRVMADWYLCKPTWQHLYGPEVKINFMKTIAKQWKCDGAIIHYNRGCEMMTQGAPEIRLALQEAGLPVMTYEANGSDAREFDAPRVQARIDAFMESQGLRILKA